MQEKPSPSGVPQQSLRSLCGPHLVLVRHPYWHTCGECASEKDMHKYL